MFSKLKESIVNYNLDKGIKSFFEKCRWFNIQLTTAFDITTTIHWSVPLLLLFWTLYDTFQAGIATIAFLSIIPHEYGHALAARLYGIKTSKILLYPLGGVALLEVKKDIKLEKVKELVVAAAGPAVTLALALFGLLMLMRYPLPTPPVKIGDIGLWFWVFIINTMLFVFNLIPAFPMDGGRILRGFIALFTTHLRSTQYAYYCSVFFCILLGIFGICFGSLTIPLTMILVHMLARMEYLQVKNDDEKQPEKILEKK